MNKAIKAAAAAAALAVSLTACTTGGSPSGPETTGQQSTTAAETTPAPAATTEAPPKEPDSAAFGETWAYEDGIGVTVTLIGPSMAGPNAFGAEATAGQIYLFDVQITNGSDKPFDPVMASTNVNFGTAGSPAQQVFDVAAGLGNSFQGQILPGMNQTIRSGWAIPTDAPQDVVVTVTPSYEHRAAIFYGAAVTP